MVPDGQLDLSVAQALKDALQSYLTFAAENKDGIAAAEDLTNLILRAVAFAGSPFVGLFALLKFLNGRKPDKIERDQDAVSVQIGDTYVITQHKTRQLAEDLSVREGAKKFISVLKNRYRERCDQDARGARSSIYTGRSCCV